MSVRDWPCFVISLKRQPERLQQFQANNRHVGLDIRHFEAVEGAALDPAALVAQRLLAPNAKVAPGMLGAAMSHRTLWQRCIEAGRPVIVFEDDARLRADFVARADGLFEAVPDFDILTFGFNTDHAINVRLLPDCDTLCTFSVPYPGPAQMNAFAAQTEVPAAVPLRGQFGSCAYAMSPKGAATFLKRCFPLDNAAFEFAARMRPYRAFSLDGLKNTVYRHVAAYVSLPPIALSPNDQKMSATGGAAAAAFR